MISLAQRRQQILEEMSRLERLQRGYLSEQHYTRQRDGRSYRLGPYYVVQHGTGERRKCRRVPADEVASVEVELAAWRHFEQLSEEFVNVTEQMTLQEREDADGKKKARRSSKRVTKRAKRS